LTTDGDGVTSWSAAGTGDVTAAAALTDNLIVRGDVADKAVQTSGITIDDADNVSGMGTLGCGNITSTGTLEASAGTSINEFSTDGTLAGDSDDAAPTEKAVKLYGDDIISRSWIGV